jgi:hypothetical protein
MTGSIKEIRTNIWSIAVVGGNGFSGLVAATTSKVSENYDQPIWLCAFSLNR